jgi:hypothetical protein
MATRIYRPDASKTWREASATSSNEAVSQILAKYSTDLNNKRLKRGMTRAETAMTLADQRTQVWGKAYEKVGNQIKGQVTGYNNALGTANQHLTEVNRIAGRIATLDKDWKKVHDGGTWTPEYQAQYEAERGPLADRYGQLAPIWKAETKQNTQTKSIIDRNNRQYASLVDRYNRATKRQKQSVNAYKNAVNRYNSGFYPVG